MSGPESDPHSLLRASRVCGSPELLCLDGDGSEEAGEEEQQRGVMVLMPRFSAEVGLGRARRPQETDGYGFLIYFLSTFQLRSNKPRINLITLICTA